MTRLTLNMTARHHANLESHLFPGDGKEAGAILLCRARAGAHHYRLLVREVHPIPYSECSVRTPVQLTWSTDCIVPLLDRAQREGLTVLKVHSHPSGFKEFSAADDEGDERLMPAVRDWIEDDSLRHGSLIMLPGGEMFGRYLDAEGLLMPIDAIQVVGDDLRRWAANERSLDFVQSQVVAFGEETFKQFSELSIGVVGCSGTGAPLIEQLARLGARELVLVDDDVVKTRNLNRIPHATRNDAEAGRSKVDVLARAVERMGLGTKVRTVKANLWTAEAVQAIAQCDVVFGCMDSIDGRFLLNQLATYYLIPYFDVGVRLVAGTEGKQRGQILGACGSVHYLQPGGSSLLSRGLFAMSDVAHAGLQRRDPAAHAQQVKDGYIRGAPAEGAAVISINFQLAATAATELIARLRPFRDYENRRYEHLTIDFTDMTIFKEQYTGECPVLKGKSGLGDVTPILGMVELGGPVRE